METEDVVTLLQHNRHDLLNQLQVVQGYLQLNNVEKAEQRMAEVFQSFNEERKLFSLNIPKVLLWILQFNIFYKNYNLTYDIDIENRDLHNQDTYIYMKLKEIMQWIESKNEQSIKNFELEFRDYIDYCIINIYLERNNLNELENELRMAKLEGVDIDITEHAYQFQIRVSYP